jgi:hypothetical protein
MGANFSSIPQASVSKRAVSTINSLISKGGKPSPIKSQQRDSALTDVYHYRNTESAQAQELALISAVAEADSALFQARNNNLWIESQARGIVTSEVKHAKKELKKAEQEAAAALDQLKKFREEAEAFLQHENRADQRDAEAKKSIGQKLKRLI